MKNVNRGKRGQLQTMALMFVGLIGVGFLILVFMYTGSVLNTQFNASCAATGGAGAGAAWCDNVSNHALEWRNISASVVNFTGQLGTVGTIAGVMLLLALIGGAGLWAYGKTRGGGGTGF